MQSFDHADIRRVCSGCVWRIQTRNCPRLWITHHNGSRTDAFAIIRPILQRYGGGQILRRMIFCGGSLKPSAPGELYRSTGHHAHQFFWPGISMSRVSGGFDAFLQILPATLTSEGCDGLDGVKRWWTVSVNCRPMVDTGNEHGIGEQSWIMAYAPSGASLPLGQCEAPYSVFIQR